MANHPSRRRVAIERAATNIAHNHERDYSGLLEGVRASFAQIGKPPLFVTDATGLNTLYLDSMPAERQVHNCHACRHFIERFGGLVTVADGGELVPAMWTSADVPEFYHPVFEALYNLVAGSRVVSPFLSKLETWGTPITGSFSHIAVTPHRLRVFQEGALTAGQAMAAKREDYRTVASALGEFSAAKLDEGLRVMRAGALVRSERFIGPLQWLRDLHDLPKGRAGTNLLWRAIATAPAGYCHPRASVLAPLLDDIAAGKSFEDIKGRFDAMMHPLRYQRPQAAPTAGNIKAAEELVEKLGIARSLERRFARLDEVQTSWLPMPAAPPPDPSNSGGRVFDHLKPLKGVPRVALPPVTMTWEKFCKDVLPQAERIELKVPGSGNFEAYLTAAHPDAPLIFKWPNPFSSYVYHGGSQPSQWGLKAGEWTTVVALSPGPNTWASPQGHLGVDLLMVLSGAADTRTSQGNALFPETLRDDLHGVRSTIEAYSKRATIGPAELPGGGVPQLASGYGLSSVHASCTLRAWISGAWQAYEIDRWE